MVCLVRLDKIFPFMVRSLNLATGEGNFPFSLNRGINNTQITLLINWGVVSRLVEY